MNDAVYQEYVSPYRLNRDVLDALSNLGFTDYGKEDDKLANVIPFQRRHPEGLVSSLRKLYTFRDVSAVSGFLEEHPFLIQLLLKAHKEIRRVFPGAHLALKVVADPEAQEERELFLFIQTELPPRAARPLLNELDREWWLNAMLDARGEMNIGLEYVSRERV